MQSLSGRVSLVSLLLSTGTLSVVGVDAEGGALLHAVLLEELLEELIEKAGPVQGLPLLLLVVWHAKPVSPVVQVGPPEVVGHVINAVSIQVDPSLV